MNVNFSKNIYLNCLIYSLFYDTIWSDPDPTKKEASVLSDSSLVSAALSENVPRLRSPVVSAGYK